MPGLLLKTLYSYKRRGRFQLHAFVLMPEHVHRLLTPANDVTLERVIQLIKGGYSHPFGLEFRGQEVWQRGFIDHRIRDFEDFARHREYIHQNPVKRRLVERAMDYRYCSPYPGFRLDERTSAAEAAIAWCPFGMTQVVPFPKPIRVESFQQKS